MTIQEYIDKQYDGSATWFMEEVNQKNHVARIASVVANMDYLAGRHKVLSREDCYYKGKVLRTRKTILNYAKTVLRFHDTFLLLPGSDRCDIFCVRHSDICPLPGKIPVFQEDLFHIGQHHKAPDRTIQCPVS